MEDVKMAADDYVLWLKGLFDAIGDRLPTPEEWDKLRDQNVMQVGDVVMRRIEEREIAQRVKLQEARDEEAKRKMQEAQIAALAQYQQLKAQYANPITFGGGSIGIGVTAVEDPYSGSITISTADNTTDKTKPTLREKLLGFK